MGEIADYYSPGGGAPEGEFDEDCYIPSILDHKRTKTKMPYQKKNYGRVNTAELEKELIVVELSGAGQYGPYIKANGEFYGMNEPLTNEDFQKGEAYTILFKRGKPSDKNPNGKKFIHQIVADGAPAPAAAAAGTADIAKPVPDVRAAKEVAKTEYAAKSQEEAKGKTRCALLAALFASPYMATQSFDTTEAFFEACTELAEKGVSYSFGGK